jgi:putative heme-binding domain-containing protein
VLNGDGHAVGPDLATAKHRGREALLQHIVEPDREVLPAYIAYVAVTRDGQTFSGLIAGETANSITLRRAEGLEDSILRANLAKLESSGRSLMSEGLLEDLGVEEVADLLEFLTTPEPPAEETRR